jgi:hypothetical protein
MMIVDRTHRGLTGKLSFATVPSPGASGKPTVMLHGARAALREEDCGGPSYIELAGLGMR